MARHTFLQDGFGFRHFGGAETCLQEVTDIGKDAVLMIQLKNIVVRFGDFTALHDINVHVKEGEFFTFLGPSGCGKTTTLRTITGFIDPVEGTVHVKDKDITHVPIEDRNIGIVFQS